MPDFFGEMGLLTREGRAAATVRAVSACELFYLSRSAYARLVDMYPSFEQVTAHGAVSARSRHDLGSSDRSPSDAARYGGSPLKGSSELHLEYGED